MVSSLAVGVISAAHLRAADQARRRTVAHAWTPSTRCPARPLAVILRHSIEVYTGAGTTMRGAVAPGLPGRFPRTRGKRSPASCGQSMGGGVGQLRVAPVDVRGVHLGHLTERLAEVRCRILAVDPFDHLPQAGVGVGAKFGPAGRI